MIMFSWGSGANAWGVEKDEKFTKPNHWDGMLEVVGVTGVVHLGQIQSGLRSAIRLCQVSLCHSFTLKSSFNVNMIRNKYHDS